MSLDQPFNGIFGRTKELDLLQFMIAEPNDFYNISDLSDILMMHRDTVSRIVEKFEKNNMVEFRPGRGRSKNYRLRGDSKIVRSLDILSAALIDEKVPGIGVFESTIESFLPYSKNMERPVQKPGWGSSNLGGSIDWSLGDPNSHPKELACCSTWGGYTNGGIS